MHLARFTLALLASGLVLPASAPAQAPTQAPSHAPSHAPSQAQALDPLELRLAQAWRWRQILPPPEARPRFTLVRPWGDEGLIVLDQTGLRAFDGWHWSREPGWEQLAGRRIDEVYELPDGLVVIMGRELVSIDRAGKLSRNLLAEYSDPPTLPTRLPDGSLVMPVGRHLLRIRSVDLGTLEPLWDLPDGATRYTAVTADAEDRYWCATDTGIFRRDDAGWQPVTRPSAADAPIKHAISLGGRLHFLPATIDTLSPGFVWDGERLAAFHDQERPVAVGDLALTPDDELVFSINSTSLRVYRDGLWADVTPALTTLERIRSICVTAQRRLALVTSSGRLWVCDLASRRWEAHDPSDAGLSPSIAAIAPSAARGGLWIGTHAGVGRWDGRGFTDVHRNAGSPDLPLRQVTGLMEDARGRLWAGSGSGFHGALCLDGGTWTHYAGEADVGARFVHVIRRIGDDLWFAQIGDDIPGMFERGGAVRLRGDVFERFPTADGSEMLRTYDVVRTHDGRILAGTRHRLYELVDDAWQPWDLPLLQGRTAWVLHPGPDGTLWMGLGLHEEGLIRVDPDRSAHLLNEGAWLYSSAASFCRTGDDRLWFASVAGLFLADGNDCHEISGKLPARNFWPIVSDEASGLWLGTLGSGLVHYSPDDREPPRTLSPHVSVDVANRHTLVRCDATDRWNVTLPEQLRFRVWLDGRLLPLKGEWSGELRTHMVDLGRLPWGRHTVAVEAVDGLGNSSGRRSESFDVEPPIWLRPPLLASMGAVALALGWIVVAGRGRRRERRAAQRAQAELAERLSVLARKLLSSQEDERRSISRELHDDLGQLLTSVCLDLEHAERAGEDERRTVLARGLSTTRTALDRVRAISSLLRPPMLDDLGIELAVTSLIEEFTTRSGVDVQVALDFGAEPIPDLLAGQVFRIIQEALTNVARHAEAETAYVTVTVRDDRLDLTVSDDGRGFDVDSVPMHHRFGLLGMRERAELLGGSFRLQSAAGSGTSIRVSMPLSRAGSDPADTRTAPGAQASEP
jgi:signal transduction histidine kinase